MDSSKSPSVPRLSDRDPPISVPIQREAATDQDLKRKALEYITNLRIYYDAPRDQPISIPIRREGESDQDIKCAKLALEYYNKRNGKKYELVEAGYSTVFLYRGMWFHCNFKAKPCRNTCGDGNEKASTKSFFAELRVDSELGRRVVTACRILRGKPIGGCQFCYNIIAHPTHGFRMGLCRDKLRALRSNRSSLVDDVSGHSLV
ncbi:unnamed protein product [Cuscuta epithymum]|uniref:DUF3615 domain-containing protein n=1 Tax=Cuscuta epithymum TaxID=186058 RepID=A0AAV0G412_9ASTE|nr:unnamed protein product [Cuscuta epithymum]